MANESIAATNGDGGDPTPETVLKIIKDAWVHLQTKEGVILMSSLVLIVIWGPKGIPIFKSFFDGWIGSDPFDAPYRLQLLSYATGVLLLVAMPFLFIKLRFKEPLKSYGLGLGNVRLGLLSMTMIIVICVVPFYFGAQSPEMAREYPMIYQGLTPDQIRAHFSWGAFLGYELIYASFFFVIEFIFRGYLLFGLRERFGYYAVLFQMLSYTAWHLPKPVPELIGTPVWGFAVAAVALRCNSMIYVFLAHWLLNIFLDIMILHHQHVL